MPFTLSRSIRLSLIAALIGIGSSNTHAAPTKTAYTALNGISTAGACVAPNVWDAAVSRCFSSTAATSVVPGSYVRYVLNLDAAGALPPGSNVVITDSLLSGQTAQNGTLTIASANNNAYTVGTLPSAGGSSTVATWNSSIHPSSGDMVFHWGANELWAYPSVSVPASPASVSMSSWGDGFIAQKFVTGTGKTVILATSHHVDAGGGVPSNSPLVKCIDTAGNNCNAVHGDPAGGPFLTVNTATSFRMNQYGNKVYVVGVGGDAKPALGCVDISGADVAACAGVSAIAPDTVQSDRESVVGSKLVGSRLYYAYATSGNQVKLACWNLANSSACFTPIVLSGTALSALSDRQAMLELSSTRFALSTSAGYYCVDDNGGSPTHCNGGAISVLVDANGKATSAYSMSSGGYLFPTTSAGVITGFCGRDEYRSGNTCWNLSGGGATAQSYYAGNNITPAIVIPGSSKILLTNPAVYPNNFYCLDTATHAPCGTANPSSSTKIYGGEFVNSSCLVTFSDDEKYEFFTVNGSGSFSMVAGCAGSSSPGSVNTTLRVSNPVPQLCSPASKSTTVTWQNLVLPTPPTSSGGQAKLYSYTNGSSTSVAGETLLATLTIPATTSGVATSVPLGLSYASYPNFKIVITLSGTTGLNDGDTIATKVTYTTADSSTPQICFDTVIGASCPTGSTSGGGAPAGSLNSFSISGGFSGGPYKVAGGYGGQLACVPPSPVITITKALTQVVRNGVTLTGGSLPTNLRASDKATYTITLVESNGGSGSEVLTETVPANTSYSGSSEGWTAACVGAGTSCTQTVALTANQTVTRTFTVTLASSLADNVTTISNTVAATDCSRGGSVCAVSTPTAPKLSLAKTGPAVLAAGGTGSYGLTLSNLGGSATSGTITLTDTLPAGLSFVSQTSGASSLACSAAGQIITCTGTPAIAAGGSVSVGYSVSAGNTASGNATNAAQVTAGDPRTASCNNAAPAAGSSNQSTDKLCAKHTVNVTQGVLRVVKSLLQVVRGGITLSGGSLPSTVLEGDKLIYRIAVTETAGSAAQTVLTETVPTNTSYAGSGEGWAGPCAAAASTCSQTVPVNANQTVNVQYSVTVANPLPSNTTTIANTVSASTGCAAVGAVCSVSRNTGPKLVLAKSGPSVLALGGNSDFTLTLQNIGGSATSGTVTLTDTLPAGMSYVSQVSGSLSCNGSGATITCTGSPGLAAGASLSVSYRVAVSPSAVGPLTNSAQVTAGDPRTANCDNAAPAAGSSNQSTDKLCAKRTTSVSSGSPQVSKALTAVVRGGITLSGGSLPSHVRPSDQLVYTLTAQETTGSAAVSTVLTETVPANTSYTGSGELWPGGCAAAGSTCNQTLNLSAGQTLTRTFTVTAASSLPSNVTQISNVVTTSVGLCSACTVTTPTAPKLSLTKSGSATLAAGGTGSYTLVLANLGGSSTSGTVTVQDTLPAGLSYASQTAGAASLSCSASGQVVTCSGTPNLAAAGSVTLSFTVNVSAASSGLVTNAAQVTSGDPRSANCDNSAPSSGSSNQSGDGLCAKHSLTVIPALITVNKSLTQVTRGGSVLTGGSLPSSLRAGDQLVYTLTLAETNGAAGSVSLTETVPANTSYTGSNEGWGAGCATAGSSCSQTVALAANQTLSKTFTVTVASPLPDNTASIANTVASSACLTVGSHCSTSLPTSPKLTLQKAGSSSIAAGGTGSFNLTLTNIGGSATSGVVTVTDTLPTGLVFVAQTSGSLACSAAGTTITCTGTPGLVAGGSLTLGYTVSAGLGVSGTGTNSARISTGDDPPVCDNAAPAAGNSNQSTDRLCAKRSISFTSAGLAVRKSLGSVLRGGTTLSGASLPTQLQSGDQLNYTLTVTESAGAAGTVLLTETVPGSSSYTGSGEGWSNSCSSAGTTCTQSVTVAANRTEVRHFTVTLATLADNVRSIANNLSSDKGCNLADCSHSLPTAPKLQISKAGPAVLAAGGTGSYSIAVSNVGGSTTAGTVSLADTLPSGLSFATQTAGVDTLPCSASGQVLTCAGAPNLAPGNSLTLSYTVAVDSGSMGLVTNTVQPSSPPHLGGDPRTASCDSAVPATGSGNQSSDKLCARWSATITASNPVTSKTLHQVVRGGSTLTGSSLPTTVRAADQLGYRISITNTGNLAASTVLTETVPAATHYSGASEGWTNTCAAAGSTCTQTLTVPAASTVTIDFTVTVDTLPAGITTIHNAVASSVGACIDCEVQTPTAPRLSVSKQGPARIAAGGTADYSLLLRNDGGTATSGTVSLDDTLPASLSFASQLSGAPALVCTGNGNTISCTGTPDIAAGGSLSLSYRVNVASSASGTATNAVRYTATGGDPRTPSCNNAAPTAGQANQSDDQLCASTSTPVDAGGATVKKSVKSIRRNGTAFDIASGALPPALMPGDEVRYALVVTEGSGKASAHVTLQETVPTNTRYSGQGEGWSGCAAAGSTCSQTIDLAASAQQTLDFTATVDASFDSAVSHIINTVAATGAACDTCSDDRPVGSSVSGSVWVDTNHNRKLDAGEAPRAGVQVQVLDANGQPVPGVPPVLTDAQGHYAIAGLAPGADYQLQFKSSSTGQVYGSPTSNDQTPALRPGDPAQQLPGGTSQIGDKGDRLLIRLQAGANLVSQSLPLDPSGVVFDAQSREPVEGVTITLQPPAGFDPAQHLVGGAASLTQTTSLNGAIPGSYQFLLVRTAPQGRYCLGVQAAGYFAPAVSIPAAAAAIAVPSNGQQFSVNKDGVTGVPPPQVGQDTTYYLCFDVNPALAGNIINNHIPVELAANPVLHVSKAVDKPRASVGDLVRYSVTLRLVDGARARRIVLSDTMPAGFARVPGTLQLSRQGPRPIKAHAVPDPVDAKTGRTILGGRWQFTVPAEFLPLLQGESLVLSYRARIGVGALQGDGVNRAKADTETSPSNEARAKVTVDGGIFDNRACVAGKVFVDCNGNHIQDAEEVGVPGVRLYLEDGTNFITDAEGKYSFCGLSATTHVLKVDGTTLPRQSRLTTSSNRNAGDASSLFIDARFGQLSRGDFVEGSCSNTVMDQVMARRSRAGHTVPEPETAKSGRLKFQSRPPDTPPQGTPSANQPMAPVRRAASSAITSSLEGTRHAP